MFPGSTDSTRFGPGGHVEAVDDFGSVGSDHDTQLGPVAAEPRLPHVGLDKDDLTLLDHHVRFRGRTEVRPRKGRLHAPEADTVSDIEGKGPGRRRAGGPTG